MPEVTSGSSLTLSGASGTVKIIAPFPWSDSSEVPYKLVALTFAKILEPHAKLKGADLSVEMGIKQERLLMIVDVEPLQSVSEIVNVSSSLSLILIV